MINGWLRAFLGFVVGVVSTAGLAYYFTHDNTQAQQQLAQQLLQAQADLKQAQLQNQTLDTQLSLDQATQQALEQSLGQKQDEIGALRDQLAFYDHLLPLSGSGTVHIRALELAEDQTDGLLHYKLLLQRPAGLEPFKGHIQFMAQGLEDEASETIVLHTAGTDPVESTEIQFDQFLRTTGLLALPPNLKIDVVTLHIYQGKQLRATHKVNLGLK